MAINLRTLYDTAGKSGVAIDTSFEFDVQEDACTQFVHSLTALHCYCISTNACKLTKTLAARQYTLKLSVENV